MSIYWQEISPVLFIQLTPVVSQHDSDQRASHCLTEIELKDFMDDRWIVQPNF
jgi:hypothetical protein